MQSDSQNAAMLMPQTVDAALDALAQPGAIAVAGASWVMRAGLRHEKAAPIWVSLAGIREMDGVTPTDGALRIGALVTHERLAAALADFPGLRVLAQAAGNAANPGVRRIATVGGNLCAAGFAAADLVPALLALDASVEIATPQGCESLPMPAFLARRADGGPLVLVAVSVPRRARYSAHRRLTIRRAGDYPIAILSVCAEITADGTISEVSVAVGGVEDVATRWSALEAALQGQRLEPAALAALARAHTGGFSARDGLDAPGWYRLRILPSLVRQAFAEIEQEMRT